MVESANLEAGRHWLLKEKALEVSPHFFLQLRSECEISSTHCPAPVGKLFRPVGPDKSEHAQKA